MSLSVKETKTLDKFISTFQKNLVCEQNSDPHSAASTKIVKSSNPSWSLTPGPVDGSDPIPESNFDKTRKRKDKNYKLHEYMEKHITYMSHLVKFIKKHLFNVGN